MIILLFCVLVIPSYVLFKDTLENPSAVEKQAIVIISAAVVCLFLITLAVQILGPQKLLRPARWAREIFRCGLYGDLYGIGFNPVTWYIFRGGVALTAAAAATGLLWSADLALGSEMVNWFVASGMFTAFAFWFWQAEPGDGEEVPFNHAALVTWLGMPLPIYRVNGPYPWTGKRLGFDRTREVKQAKDKPIGGNADGFIFLGQIPIQIWNEADEEGVIQMKNIAKNFADITGTLTIVPHISNLRKWISSDDPILDLADRARAAYRTVKTFFTDRDIAEAKTVVGKLMSGKHLLTCFLLKGVEGYERGQMVRDESDLAMFEIVRDDETVADATTRFLRRIEEELAPSMRARGVIARNADGTPRIRELYISETLDEVAEAVGTRIDRATIGNIVLSDPVRVAANSASSEVDQARAMLASARATKASRRELILTKKQLENPSYEMATMLPFAQDNPNAVQVVYTPGGNALVSAAVAGASQINKGKGGA